MTFIITSFVLSKQLFITPTGPFTVLAPTNNAINSVDADLLTAMGREPVLLKQIVQYHLIPDYNVLPELTLLGTVTSLEGQPITFSGSGAVNIIKAIFQLSFCHLRFTYLALFILTFKKPFLEKDAKRLFLI